MMAFTQRGGILAKGAALFDRLGACGNIGLIIGIICGGLLSLLSLMRPGPLAPTWSEVLGIIVLLSLFCWLAVLFVYFYFLRQRVLPVALVSLTRAVIICAFTVLITHALGNYTAGLLVGILVGLFFGLIFCRVLNRILG